MRFEGVRSPSRGAGAQNPSVQNVFRKRVLLLFIQHRTSSTCTGTFLGSGTETGGRGVRPGWGAGEGLGQHPMLESSSEGAAGGTHISLVHGIGRDGGCRGCWPADSAAGWRHVPTELSGCSPHPRGAAVPHCWPADPPQQDTLRSLKGEVASPGPARFPRIAGEVEMLVEILREKRGDLVLMHFLRSV